VLLRGCSVVGIRSGPKSVKKQYVSRNVGTSYLRHSYYGRQTVRHVVGGAGLRCRKKRMPFCNGMDTGLNVTRLERELTSVGHSNLVPGQVLCREKISGTFLKEKSSSEKANDGHLADASPTLGKGL
jgi:hypothetical protein